MTELNPSSLWTPRTPSRRNGIDPGQAVGKPANDIAVDSDAISLVTAECFLQRGGTNQLRGYGRAAASQDPEPGYYSDNLIVTLIF